MRSVWRGRNGKWKNDNRSVYKGKGKGWEFWLCRRIVKEDNRETKKLTYSNY